MKSKIFRLLGVALIVTILASLFAIPIPVSAGTDEWDRLTFPTTGSTGGFFWDTTAALTNVGPLAMAKDGTLFLHANPDPDGAGAGVAVNEIFKSTDGGKTWTGSSSTTKNFSNAANAAGAAAVAIATSRDDAQLLYAATATTVFKSADGGTTYANVAPGGGIGVGEAITSVTTGLIGGVPYVFIGTSNGALGGKVYFVKDAPPAFGGGPNAFASLGAPAGDVFAVATSPDFNTTQGIVAVIDDGAAGPALRNKVHFFSGGAWDPAAMPAIGIGVAASAATAAAAGFPDNYTFSAASEFLVGLSDGGGAGGGVYRMVAGVGINGFGAASTVDVVSVGVKGNIGGYTVLGGTGAGAVWRSADGAAATWNNATKGPSGPGAVSVVMDANFSANQKALAAVSGSPEGAVSVTMDGGKSFNQISMIDSDVAGANAIREIALSPTYATDKIIYVLAQDAAGNDSVWKNDGTSWTRVAVSSLAFVPAGNTLETIALSPAGDALFLGDNTAPVNVYRSIDGGATFSKLAFAPGAVNSWVIIDKDTIVAGGVGTTYKTTNAGALPWTEPTQKPTAAMAVTDIKKSPNYAADNTLILGNANREVFRSTDAAANWGTAAVGAVTGAAGANNTFVAFDRSYSTNTTIYAAAGAQIDRFVIGTTTTRSKLLDAATDNDTVTAGAQLADGQANPVTAATTFSSIVAAADGAVYAAANDAGPTVAGILRSLSATNTATAADVGAMWESVNKSSAAAAVTQLNKLYLTTGSTTAWGHQAGTIWRYTDNFTGGVALDTPADNATLSTTTTAAIKWTPMTGATSYDVQYGTRSDLAGSITIAVAPITATETSTTLGDATPAADVALANNTTYYWRVRVSGNSPVLSRWSDTRKFSTALPAVGAPPVIAPAPGASGVSTTPTLSWGAVAGATGYEIQLAQKPDFSDAVTKTSSISAFAWPDALTEGGVYYWRVRATTATGQSAWITGVFTTAPKPVPPITPTVSVSIPPQPAPTITVTVPPITVPAPTVTVSVPPQAPVTLTMPPQTMPPITVTQPAPIVNIPAQVTPGYVWAIIAIGAVLVVAVIVLIVRTRRVS
ncbi:MAG: hypothetical protein HY670_06390 [Chloroflexi bacterium]|nr:hypothetical protein [Chloroflexota bacterium]